MVNRRDKIWLPFGLINIRIEQISYVRNSRGVSKNHKRMEALRTESEKCTAVCQRQSRAVGGSLLWTQCKNNVILWCLSLEQKER